LVKGSTPENDMQRHFLSSQTQEVLGGLFGQTDLKFKFAKTSNMNSSSFFILNLPTLV